MLLPDEELSFELYFNLSIAESRVRGMLVPKTLQVLVDIRLPTERDAIKTIQISTPDPNEGRSLFHCV